MTWIIAIALIMVAAGGTVVALTNNPERQAVTLSLFGLLLTLLFFLLSAPDVALSELAVGTVVVPLIVMLAVRKTRHVRKDADGGKPGEPGGSGESGGSGGGDDASEASESGEEAGEVESQEAGEGEEAPR